VAETERRNRFIIKLKIGPETFSSRTEESDENATEYKAGPEREEEGGFQKNASRCRRRGIPDALFGSSAVGL